jgi:hypothetical protein
MFGCGLKRQFKIDNNLIFRREKSEKTYIRFIFGDDADFCIC